MEPKTYTPVSTKFAFKKIKFKVLQYIQHDFIRQRLDFSKDQAKMFKSPVINYLKGVKFNFFDATNVLLKSNYL